MGSCCFRCTNESLISPVNTEMNIPANQFTEYHSFNQKRFSDQNDVLNEEANGSLLLAHERSPDVVSPRGVVFHSQLPRQTSLHNSSGPQLVQPGSIPVLKHTLLPEKKQTILRHFRYLKDELDMDSEILDFFIQEDIFTQDQVDLINAERTRRNKVDCFLRMFLRSKQNAYDTFLEILANTGNIHIRKRLQEENNETDIGDNCSNMKSSETRRLLGQNKETIINELQPELIIDYFVQCKEFTLDEYEEIISEKTRKREAIQFMKILTNDRHLPRGYFILLNALKDTGSDFLYDKLESRPEKTGDHVAYACDTYDDFECNISDSDLPTEEDSDTMLEMRILIKPKKKTKRIMKALKKPHVIQEIRDRIFSETYCVLHSAEKGSIIIKIKGCKKGQS